jgi:hypothetical protein
MHDRQLGVEAPRDVDREGLGALGRGSEVRGEENMLEHAT